MAKNKYAIQLTPELAEGIRFLADNTGKTQISIIREIILALVSKGIQYNKFTYFTDSTVGSSTIHINFLGKPKINYKPKLVEAVNFE
jgi:hypothetical protein